MASCHACFHFYSSWHALSRTVSHDGACLQVAHPVFNLGAFKLSSSSTITISVDGASGRRPVAVDAVWLTRGDVIDENGPMASRVGTWTASTFSSGFVGTGCTWGLKGDTKGD